MSALWLVFEAASDDFLSMNIDLVEDAPSFFARTLRVFAVLVGLGLIMLSSDYCPTGQTDCAMADMDMETQEAVCVLACGVPFQYSVDAAPVFIGQVSVVPVPPVVSFSDILTEPNVPPPRSLAWVGVPISISSRRPMMKTTLAAAAVLLAFGGAAFAASDCCGDLMACCAAMFECCFWSTLDPTRGTPAFGLAFSRIEYPRMIAKGPRGIAERIGPQASV
jgi:hypothetical protein